ncbi:MAG: SEC-C domain-containing protein, partial [Clostridia bacterium]|nr:SEC-C domain-containing protein [Clostridia bacterium]
LVQRELNFAIIDEVDSILIDEARSPLIISGQPAEREQMYIAAQRFAKQCTKEDYEINEEKNTIALTDRGVEKAELFFGKRAVEESHPTEEVETDEAGDPADLGEVGDTLNADLLHFINNALRANYILKKDVDYAVDRAKGEVVLIDEATGRLMVGRRLNNGLHQAVEAKENLPIRNETATLASISLQNFFRLYNKISGMTGTAKEEETEFKKTYSLDIVSIPTNKPLQRVDQEDVILPDRQSKLDAIVADIKDCHARKQPVLVGTTSVEKSVELSDLLTKEGIPHEVLNAINNRREAEIVTQAGRSGQVTIATNMAGRGTDILLGGNPEYFARVELTQEFCAIAQKAPRTDDTPLDATLKKIKEGVDRFYESLNRKQKRDFLGGNGSEQIKAEALEKALYDKVSEQMSRFISDAINPLRETSDPILDKIRDRYNELLEKHRKEAEEDKPIVLAAGGLRVIGTERHDSRRIDNQLRGRSGRQGDVGSSIFYISLEDDLLRIFGKDNSLFGIVQSTMAKAEGALSGKMVTSMIKRAQSKVENYHYSLRKSVLAYDDVMNRQREIIYAERRKVLESDDVHEEIVKMVPEIVAEILSDLIDYNQDYVLWNYDKINLEIERKLLPWGSNVVDKELASHLSFQRIVDEVSDAAIAFYEKKKQESKTNVYIKRNGTIKVKDEAGNPYYVKHDVYVMFDREAVKAEVARRTVTLSWLEKAIMLNVVDRNWKEQMVAMEELRNGIQFRALGNKDPVMCYASEGFELFDKMSENIRRETVLSVFGNLKLMFLPEEQNAALSDRESVDGRQKKVGRNDPCPCGSGKKYKNCCGKNG